MVRTDRPTPTAWVGIDVSQDTLDAGLLPAPGGKARAAAFPNDGNGHAALTAWAEADAGGAGVGFCLESTGAYGEALALHLAAAGRHVAVVNPARIKYAGLMRGQGNKTDRADARLIAEYATRERPAAWQPPRPEVRELQALSRRRDDLRQLAAREKGRLAAPGLSAAVRKSITRTIAFLEKEADRLQDQADELIAASEGLRADRDLLRTIPGIGPVAAPTLLAELPDPNRFDSAQQAAAYQPVEKVDFGSNAPSISRKNEGLVNNSQHCSTGC